MIYKIKVKANDHEYKVTSRDLRNADWVETGETAPRWIDIDPWRNSANANLVVLADDDDDDFTRYEAELRVRENGRVTVIQFEIVYDWGREETSYYVMSDDGRYREAEIREEWWGNLLCAHDFCKMVGLPLNEPEIDYDELAEKYIADHPEYRWWEADERGFANEWHLVAAPAGFDPEGYSYELRPLTAEEAVRDLAIAVMPDKEYKVRYGLDHCISAVVED